MTETTTEAASGPAEAPVPEPAAVGGVSTQPPNAPRKRALRQSASNASDRIRAVLHWEGVDERSAEFRNVARRMDEELSNEKQRMASRARVQTAAAPTEGAAEAPTDAAADAADAPDAPDAADAPDAPVAPEPARDDDSEVYFSCESDCESESSDGSYESSFVTDASDVSSGDEPDELDELEAAAEAEAAREADTQTE